MSQSAENRGSISPYLVVLLAAAMFLNYADRASISIVSPLLKRQLALSNSEMGLLLSAFFWSYTAAQPVAGWVAQRFAPRTVLSVAAALWSVATLGCGFATRFATFFALRLSLGIAESAIFPTTARIFAESAPDRQRGRCNAAMSAGTALGPSFGVVIGAMILVAYGWRAVFFALGGLSLLWLVPWLAFRDRSAALDPGQKVEPASYLEILRQRALWGTCLAQLCWAYPFYLVLTWLPLYLVNSQHFSLGKMASITAALYGLQAIGAVASGWASDFLIARGRPPQLVRKLFVIGGMGATGLLFGCSAFAEGAAATIPIIASGFTVGFSYTMVFTIGQSLAGPTAAGRWMGIQNMAGNLAGIAAPIMTGLAVDWSGSFAGAFLIAAGLSAIGVLSWVFIVPTISQVVWRPAKEYI